MEKKAPLLSAPKNSAELVSANVDATASQPQAVALHDSRPAKCTSFFRRRLFAQFSDIQHGHLTLREMETIRVFGDQNAPGTEIIIHNPRCYRRLALGGAIGAAEAFIDGDWSTPDLIGVIRLFAKNEDYLRRSINTNILSHMVVNTS